MQSVPQKISTGLLVIFSALSLGAWTTVTGALFVNVPEPYVIEENRSGESITRVLTHGVMDPEGMIWYAPVHTSTGNKIREMSYQEAIHHCFDPRNPKVSLPSADDFKRLRSHFGYDQFYYWTHLSTLLKQYAVPKEMEFLDHPKLDFWSSTAQHFESQVFNGDRAGLRYDSHGNFHGVMCVSD